MESSNENKKRGNQTNKTNEGSSITSESVSVNHRSCDSNYGRGYHHHLMLPEMMFQW